MKAAENKLTFQFELWSIIGPALTLLTLFVLLFAAQKISIFLPTAALIGFFFSWKWKVKGLVATLVLLLLTTVYLDQYIQPDFRLWQLGLVFSFALSSLVTALCQEETTNYFQTAKQEIPTQQNTAPQFDEKLKEAKKIFELEKEKYIHQIQVLEKASKDVSKEIFEYKQKLDQSKLSQDALEHQLKIKNDEIVLLQRQIDEIAQVKNQHYENEDLNVELNELKKKLDDALEEVDLGHLHVKMLSKDLSIERDIHDQNKRALEDAQKENQVLSKKSGGLVDQLETASREKQLLETSLTKLQSTLEQLKDKIDERDLENLAHQSTIHSLQSVSNNGENLLTLEREKFEKLQAQYEAQDKSYMEQLSIVESKWLQALQELSRLQDPSQNNFELKISELEDGLRQERLVIDHTNREIRRLNGVYQQLRDQFDEKNKALDDVRRQLFLSEESYSALELKFKENNFAETAYFIKYISRLQNEIDSYDFEINQLYDLIDSLNSQSKRGRKKVQ